MCGNLSQSVRLLRGPPPPTGRNTAACSFLQPQHDTAPKNRPRGLGLGFSQQGCTHAPPASPSPAAPHQPGLLSWLSGATGAWTASSFLLDSRDIPHPHTPMNSQPRGLTSVLPPGPSAAAQHSGVGGGGWGDGPQGLERGVCGMEEPLAKCS